ncbi:MAG TPA: hypothetical protein VG735_07630 [Caulobacterales bacterium]|nr:hypothetical protein [Caulobacterales bacterium]
MAQYWFKQKRFGYGAGLPTAWQGWALLAGYLAAAGLAIFVPRLFTDQPLGVLVGVTIIIVLTVPFLLICEQRTEGGWRWRWGDK